MNREEQVSEGNPFADWCIVELFGHQRYAGYLQDWQLGGASFLRLDVPGAEGIAATQFLSPQAIYRITPTTEGIARAVALRSQPEPVQRWELPEPKEDPRPRRQTAEYCTGCGDRLPIGWEGYRCPDCEVELDAEGG